MKVEIINEDQTPEHRRINKGLKKEFENLLGRKLISGSTIHHVDPFVNDSDIMNCLCIESNTRDSNVIHLLLSYCQRYGITDIHTLIKELDKIPIYQVEFFQGTYIAENHNFSYIIKTIR